MRQTIEVDLALFAPAPGALLPSVYDEKTKADKLRSMKVCGLACAPRVTFNAMQVVIWVAVGLPALAELLTPLPLTLPPLPYVNLEVFNPMAFDLNLR